jgi:ATP-dependent RNA helicase DDX23/PRP28
MADPLLDPSLLEGLSPHEREEALAAAAAAKRAEERAEQRALERAMAKKVAERHAEAVKTASLTFNASAPSNPAAIAASATTDLHPKIKFVSKRQRLNPPAQESEAVTAIKSNVGPTTAATSTARSQTITKIASAPQSNETSKYLSEKERQTIRQTYLGKEVKSEEQTKPKRNKTEFSKKITFRFKWDDTDDTLDQSDPLYSSVAVAKQQIRQQRNDPLERSSSRTNNTNNNTKRIAPSVHVKPLEQMTARDWRIYRENFEIVVKGGRAPPPLRAFREAQLHPALLQSIETVLRYTEPTPIQRQAIPIGLERRDLIGIAETGSGKVSGWIGG